MFPVVHELAIALNICQIRQYFTVLPRSVYSAHYNSRRPYGTVLHAKYTHWPSGAHVHVLPREIRRPRGSHILLVAVQATGAGPFLAQDTACGPGGTGLGRRTRTRARTCAAVHTHVGPMGISWGPTQSFGCGPMNTERESSLSCHLSRDFFTFCRF